MSQYLAEAWERCRATELTYSVTLLTQVQGQKNEEEAQAARIAVMLTYSGMALHAPREHLLARVDADILGKILLLARAGHQVGGSSGHAGGRADWMPQLQPLGVVAS